ncbi:MAG: hypothetical protein ACLVJO_04220 [[Clostridium] scindens]
MRTPLHGIINIIESASSSLESRIPPKNS